ncbi:T9SS type A sorting domain-containing protein [Catalinimonas niigatensis]|uniref:T9SS type A sorting domain-containing protein n=1 Tax=Catalinimonas niigatensis TaxID=1397264 RepID=UPI0026654AB5|nr:T9SS type A sorting domain-containing protein [Catalinimonas niigatensis]WPP49598.1 T9SS type A sorting domain-containing protein [Catalinimonas niigatensis]
MKRLIYTITLLIISLPVIGQNYSTLDEKTGIWSQTSIWTNSNISGSFANATSTISEKNSNTEIRGTITHLGHIALSGNGAILKIASGDTLFIYGDLSVDGKSKLFVESNAVLVVTGNMEVEGNSVSNNNGLILVVQDLKVSGNTTFTNNSVIYSESTSGNQTVNGHKPLSDLENEHPDLWNTFISVQPIELLSFTGTLQANSIQLDWVTAWEENFDFFTIERASHDLQFKAIGTLKGSGNTIAEMAYSFADKNPLEGQAFYRLKATDFDGSFEYHKIISVHFEGLSSNTTSVYPNPVSYHSLKVATSEASVSEVRILDLSGHILYSQTAQTGINEISLPQNIKPGAYLLIVSGSQGKQHQQKIMVL